MGALGNCYRKALISASMRLSAFLPHSPHQRFAPRFSSGAPNQQKEITTGYKQE